MSGEVRLVPVKGAATATPPMGQVVAKTNNANNIFNNQSDWYALPVPA